MIPSHVEAIHSYASCGRWRGRSGASTGDWTVAGGKSWILPRGVSTRQPVRLALETHATRVLAPASGRDIHLTANRRRGTATIRLPRARGPYELVGRIMSKRGVWSAETTKALAG